MTAIPVSTSSLSRPSQLQSFSRRLGGSVFDGLAGAYSLRIPAGSTYSGPLLRVRRDRDNAEADFRSLLLADASGNRWLDADAVLAFVRPVLSIAGFVQSTDTVFTTPGIASLSGTLAGGNVDAPRVFAATNAIYPITANNSFWYGAIDGIYTKAVRLTFTFSGGTVGIRITEARWQNGNQLANIAQAGTWNLSSPATTAGGAGYGARDLDMRGLSGDGFITAWYDQLGNGNHALQTVANRQPRIVINGVWETENTRPAVRFENHWLFSGAVPQLTAAPVTVLQALRWTTLSAYRSSAGIGNSQATAAGVDIGVGGSGSNLYVGAANRAGTGGTSIPTTNSVLITAAHDGANTSGRMNGVDSPGSALAFTYNAAGGHITLGASRATATTSAGGGVFRIHETLFVQGILSATQRQRLEANQAAAFGITIT